MNEIIREQKNYDRLVTSTHEAGHLTVAAANGIYGSAWVAEREGADAIEENTFAGTCSGIIVVDDNLRRVVAIAGLAAELLLDDKENDAFTALDSLECGDAILSSTDAKRWQGTDQEKFLAAEEAFRILRREERFLRWAVIQLRRYRAVSADMVREAAKKYITAK